MEPSTLHARVVAAARADCLDLDPLATEESLSTFEAKYDVVVPSAMREFYVAVGGMSPGACWGGGLMSLWSLPHVRPITEELPEPIYAAYWDIEEAGHWFCFADLFIHAEVYAVRLSAQPRTPSHVISVCEGHQVVAESFTQFIRMCLDDPHAPGEGLRLLGAMTRKGKR